MSSPEIISPVQQTDFLCIKSLFHPIQAASLSLDAKILQVKAVLKLKDSISSTEIPLLYAGHLSNLLQIAGILGK